MTEPGRIGHGQGQVLGLGWLQGTTRTADRADVIAYLVGAFGVAVERRQGLPWYQRSWAIGDAGVVVGAEPRSSSSLACEVFVSIPQMALDGLGWDGSLLLLGALRMMYGLRPSRLDVYLDDRDRLADPEVVLEALRRRDLRSYVRAYHWAGDSDDGMTTYIGSRSGDCMVRVYRKWAESGDPEQGVRWEMEAKGERAALVADALVSAAAPGERFVQLLRAFVDFVDRSDVSRGDRAPLLAWWSALVDGARRVGLALPRKVDELARRRAWVRRAVAPTLAVLVQAYGWQGPGSLGAMIAEEAHRAPLRVVGGFSRRSAVLLPHERQSWGSIWSGRRLVTA